VRIEITEYFQKNYDSNIILRDFETENLGFDAIASQKNINILVEYKSRFFESGINDRYLKEYDVLIELIQSVPSFQKLPELKNNNINRLINSYKVNTAVGWFYKCIADRLIFFRFLDNAIYDVIDIDFRFFKQWVMNVMSNLELQYSDKTTGTINAKVPLKAIPKPLLKYKNYGLMTKISNGS